MKLLNFRVIRNYLEDKYSITLYGLILFGIGVIASIINLFNLFALWFGFLLFGMIFLLYGLISIWLFKSDLKELNNKTIDEISDWISNHDYTFYKSLGIITFRDYFVYMTHGFKIVRYDELLWLFFNPQRNLPSSFYVSHNVASICFYLKNGDYRHIVNLPKGALEQEALDFIDYVKMVNKNIVIGNDEKTSNKMLEIIRKLKK